MKKKIIQDQLNRMEEKLDILLEEFDYEIIYEEDDRCDKCGLLLTYAEHCGDPNCWVANKLEEE